MCVQEFPVDACFRIRFDAKIQLFWSGLLKAMNGDELFRKRLARSYLTE